MNLNIGSQINKLMREAVEAAKILGGDQMNNNMVISNVIFRSRGEAEDSLSRLIDIVDNYGQATVADLNDLSGVHSTFLDTRIGWTNLKNSIIFRQPNGYALYLPKPISLKDEYPKKEQTINPITISFPNIDESNREGTLCPSEVIQRAYINKIGQKIYYCGAPMTVKSVKITEETITIELE